jgi:hypothetical protein
VRNGITCVKIPKTSRDSLFKVARSKARSKMRGHYELQPEDSACDYIEPRTPIHYVPFIIEPEFDVPIVHWPYISEVPFQAPANNNQSFATIASQLPDWFCDDGY